MSERSAARITRLPGTSCRHFALGRCLYEEALNPGYHEAWRCSVLRRWEAVYDEFLDRAERFDLEETNLPELWRRRFNTPGEGEPDCPSYEPGLIRDMPECRHLFADLCLLELPECHGQCRNYRLREPQKSVGADTDDD